MSVAGSGGVFFLCVFDSGSDHKFGNKMYHCTSMSWVFHHFQKRGPKKGLRGSVLNVPNRSVSCADLGMAGLHAVTGGQALLQQRRKLLRELLPVLFPDLVLEAVQDLGGRKHKNASVVSPDLF